VNDPLIDRLLQISNNFRGRHAKMASADEEPLITPLDAARELKKLRRVDDGLAIIAHSQKFFLEWATKYDSAFAVYGIPLLQARANLMRMFASSFRDDETAIRTLVQIEHERTQDATAARQAKTEARREAVLMLCQENGWRLDMYGLAARLRTRLAKDRHFRDEKGKLRFPVSRRSISDDLIFLATTSSSPNE
jgi:hypothetical protein